MLDNINPSEFPEVQMYKVLTESAKLYEPLWGCAHTNACSVWQVSQAIIE